MTLENAIRTLDEVIPPHTHRTVDREHMPIVLAWEAVKVELENRVPVVRCRDCKHKDTWTESKIRDWFWCGVSGLQVVEDMDFCSYGERRTDEK